MKKISTYLVSLVVVALLTAAYPPSYGTGENIVCNSKTLKKEAISILNPFYYSSSKITEITYDYKVQRKEIQVPLFKGERYKLVFNKKSLPKDVVIKIFDKDQTNSGREAIYSSEDTEGDLISFAPKKTKTLYVNYFIPEAKGMKEGGCIAFILGYQLAFLDDKKEETTEEETQE